MAKKKKDKERPARIDRVEELTDTPQAPEPVPSAPDEEYHSPYQEQLDSLTQAALEPQDFAYDPASDPLYQQYRDRYIQGGRMAMMDAMGQAASLTGGYGNSYGATAGNQAYQDYLTGLNDRALDLYDRAYGAYQDENSLLYQQLALISQAEDRAYQRHRDQAADYQAQREWEYRQQQDQQAQDNWQMEYDYKTRKWKKRPR